jgi:hypothetical protein
MRAPLVLVDRPDDVESGMTCYVSATATILGIGFREAFRFLRGFEIDDLEGEDAEWSLDAFTDRMALLGFRRVRADYERRDRPALVIGRWNRSLGMRVLHTVAWCPVQKKRIDCHVHDTFAKYGAKVVRVLAKTAEPTVDLAELIKPHPLQAMFERGRELADMARALQWDRERAIDRIAYAEESAKREAARAEAKRWAELRREADERAGITEHGDLFDPIAGERVRGRFASAMVEGLLAHAEWCVKAEALERLRRSFPPGTRFGDDAILPRPERWSATRARDTLSAWHAER